jgi:hypothetical protein
MMKHARHARLQSCKVGGRNKPFFNITPIETFLETPLNFATLQSTVREAPRSRKRSTVKSASLSWWLTLELRKDDLHARPQTTRHDSDSRNGCARGAILALESRKHVRFAVDLALRLETLVKTPKRGQNAEPARRSPSRTVLDANNALEPLAVKRTRSVARDLPRVAETRLLFEGREHHRNETRKRAYLMRASKLLILRDL